MRSFTIGRIAVATLIATTAALGCATAQAGELFVMPYACRVVGGEPVLTPSADQGYAIIGQREQRDFTACSPVNPEMCRRWTVYRFDVDCAGKRVPWTSLSAAADAQRGGRSWVENGRMQLEMPPRWNIAPDDPCARRSRYAWRSGPLSRYCADRRAMAPPPVVEMPAGFAPMLELDGIFVADGARVSGLDPAAAPAVAEQSDSENDARRGTNADWRSRRTGQEGAGRTTGRQERACPGADGSRQARKRAAECACDGDCHRNRHAARSDNHKRAER